MCVWPCCSDGSPMAADVMSSVERPAQRTSLTLSDELLGAACCGDLDAVVKLLDRNVRAVPDKDGYGALHYAAANNFPDLVALLIEHNSFDVNDKSKLGYTPIHMAAAKGHLEVVQVLLHAPGCILNTQDRLHGNTALHEAAFNGFSQTISLLVRFHSDVNIVNNSGFSALHLASQTGHNESARVLLYAGCSPDHKNNYGDTPLHTAARYGHAGVTRILISARCQLNDQNKNGDTPLHIAAALKQKKITKLLLESGVDVSIRNNLNEKALDTARRKNNDEIVQLLSSKSVESSPVKVTPLAASSASSSAEPQPSTDLAPAPPAKPKKKRWRLFSRKSKTKDTPAVADKAPPEPSVTDIDPYRRVPPSGLAPWGSALPPPWLGERGRPLTWENFHPPPWGGDPLPPRRPSGADSARFPPHMNPETVLTSFYEHHIQHAAGGWGGRGGAAGEEGARTWGRGGGGDGGGGESVYGVVDKYRIQAGVQYYRDLAGNVHQGPVGYASDATLPQPGGAAHPVGVAHPPLSNATNFRRPHPPAHPGAPEPQRHFSGRVSVGGGGAYHTNTFYQSGMGGPLYMGGPSYMGGPAYMGGPPGMGGPQCMGGGPSYMAREHIGSLRSRPHACMPLGVTDYYAGMQPPSLGGHQGPPHLVHHGARPPPCLPPPGGLFAPVPLYRSRSDETLSTASSRPSHRITHHAPRREGERRPAVGVVRAPPPASRPPAAEPVGRDSAAVRGSSVRHRGPGTTSRQQQGGGGAGGEGGRGSGQSSGSSSVCSAKSPARLGYIPEGAEAAPGAEADGGRADSTSNPDSGYCSKAAPRDGARGGPPAVGGGRGGMQRGTQGEGQMGLQGGRQRGTQGEVQMGGQGGSQRGTQGEGQGGGGRGERAPSESSSLQSVEQSQADTATDDNESIVSSELSESRPASLCNSV